MQIPKPKPPANLWDMLKHKPRPKWFTKEDNKVGVHEVNHKSVVEITEESLDVETKEQIHTVDNSEILLDTIVQPESETPHQPEFQIGTEPESSSSLTECDTETPLDAETSDPQITSEEQAVQKQEKQYKCAKC